MAVLEKFASCISIIMPAWNAAQMIEESIASVLAQDDEGWELLIVDDGSGDRKNKGVTATTCGQGRILRDVRLSQTRDAASPSPWRACRGQPSRVVRRITTRPPRGFVRRAGLGWAG